MAAGGGAALFEQGVAVAHGFGGPHGPEKVTWLGALQDFFRCNEGLEQGEVEQFLAEALDQEFDTAVEDGSLEQVSRQLLELHARASRGGMRQPWGPRWPRWPGGPGPAGRGGHRPAGGAGGAGDPPGVTATTGTPTTMPPPAPPVPPVPPVPASPPPRGAGTPLRTWTSAPRTPAAGPWCRGGGDDWGGATPKIWGGPQN
ncbi:pre-rRNA-processing protein TSR2 homolog isoform X2 [Anser cygnoides]|uniref:pre-rRNA-processing protein TSR2 homolog isoform X2 n=1 Tax=Anser cygnoides TaxID=8845 RepID=UPI0034D23FE9